MYPTGLHCIVAERSAVHSITLIFTALLYTASLYEPALYFTVLHFTVYVDCTAPLLIRSTAVCLAANSGQRLPEVYWYTARELYWYTGREVY